MLTVLSPAKTLDFKSPPLTNTATKPTLLGHSELLVAEMQGLSADRIAKLMKISDTLGQLNKQRFMDWSPPFTKANARQAILAFKGDVYRGLDVESFSEDDFKYAQQHLRILSGLYGVLRPLDLMQPYRLEMGTKLETERGSDLYQFWGDIITKELNKQIRKLKTSTLVNLASIEYFKSVNEDALKAEIVSPVFLDFKNGEYKIISFYAKKARGLMSAWIIQQRVEDPKQLQKFNVRGYRYSTHLSEPGLPTFVRDSIPD